MATERPQFFVSRFANKKRTQNSRCEMNRKPWNEDDHNSVERAITGHMHLRNKFKNTPKRNKKKHKNTTGAWIPDSTNPRIQCDEGRRNIAEIFFTLFVCARTGWIVFLLMRVSSAWLNLNMVARARAFDSIEWKNVQTFFVWLLSAAQRTAAPRTTIQIEWLTYRVPFSSVWAKNKFESHTNYCRWPLFSGTFLLIAAHWVAIKWWETQQ